MSKVILSVDLISKKQAEFLLAVLVQKPFGLTPEEWNELIATTNQNILIAQMKEGLSKEDK